MNYDRKIDRNEIEISRNNQIKRERIVKSGGETGVIICRIRLLGGKEMLRKRPATESKV